MNRQAALKAMQVKPTPSNRPIAWLPWVQAFGPFVAVLVAGLTVFSDAVYTSIASTPHPALVYGIFIIYVWGIALCARALLLFQREAEFTRQWTALPSNEARRAQVEKWAGTSRRLTWPALAALTSSLPSLERHAKFESEAQAVEGAMGEQMALPNYIAGALVGLGLVGTFVGLLGTLEDLGVVFGSLASAGDSNVNPTAVFADMVKKLQDPMKGMGTAFVASLYGLLGSLVVGLCALSVSKSANAVLDGLARAERAYAAQHVERFTADLRRSEEAPSHQQLHELVVRVLDAQALHDTHLQTWAEGSEKRFITLMDHMIEASRQASEDFGANSQKAIGSFMEIVQAQHQGAKAISDDLARQQQGLIDAVHAMSRQVQDERASMQKDMVALSERYQVDTAQRMARLEKLFDQMAQLSAKSAQALDQHIQRQESVAEGLPRTSYWKKAWEQVQDYLSRSRQSADLALMAQALRRQTELMERIDRRLSQQESQDQTKNPRA
jgi:hypothetical protein